MRLRDLWLAVLVTAACAMSPSVASATQPASSSVPTQRAPASAMPVPSDDERDAERYAELEEAAEDAAEFQGGARGPILGSTLGTIAVVALVVILLVILL